MHKRKLLYIIPVLTAIWYFWCVSFTGGGNDVLFAFAIFVGWTAAVAKQSSGKLYAKVFLAIAASVLCVLGAQVARMPARRLAVRIWRAQLTAFASRTPNGTEFHPARSVGPFSFVQVSNDRGGKDLIIAYGFEDVWGLRYGGTCVTNDQETCTELSNAWSFFDDPYDLP